MLTVKLCKGPNMRIVEATEVNVYNFGKAPGSDEDPSKRTSAVREIAGQLYSGGTFAFFISDESDPIKNGLAPTVEIWDCAYIENAHGATTERVHAY